MRTLYATYRFSTGGSTYWTFYPENTPVCDCAGATVQGPCVVAYGDGMSAYLTGYGCNSKHLALDEALRQYAKDHGHE